MGLDSTLPPPPGFPTPGADPRPGDRVGPYEVVRVLASGGQGLVAEARHADSGHPVALKLLLRPESEAVRLRFRQEAQVLARLAHPGLVGVHAFGEAGGVPYLAMERIQGRDLGARLKQGIPPFAWTAGVVAQVADAVDYCHQRGLVHRDLKPANVLIEAESGRPVLVDFGLVQRDPDRLRLTTLDERARLTQSDATPGTPPYMPPEQIDPTGLGPVGPRSDVYGLGATLFALLTGGPPFRGATTINTLVQVIREPPPDPRARNPEVPQALAELCLRCLAKHPSDRPVSAAAVAQALRDGVALGGPALDHAGRRRLQRTLIPLAVLLGGALALGLVQLARTPTRPTSVPEAVSRPEPPEPEGSHDEDGVPPWYLSQGAGSRAPLPLPEGVVFGEAADEPYRNQADGSVLVWVPPGTYELGWEKDFQNSPHRAELPGFFVGRYEVSVAQYARFCLERRHPPPPTDRALLPRPPTDIRPEPWRKPEVFRPRPEHPASWVSVEDALAYCAWAGADLPKGDEWEAAARGHHERTYPWGDEPPSSSRANLNTRDDPEAFYYLAPVDSRYHAPGASPFGCLHMAGNVAELTRDIVGSEQVEQVWIRGGHGDRQQAADLRVTDRSEPKLNGYVGFRIVVRPAER